jgi:hypothetical protein
MSPDDYESLVASLVDGIRATAPEFQELHIGFGRSNRLLGASGYKHQIDVSLEGASRVFLLECKRWEYKIGVDEVMVLVARGADIAQARQNARIHCILASKVGSTRGAITLAHYFGIELEIIVSAHEYGLRLGKRVHVGVSDGVVFGDSCTATVIRNGEVVG